jgi:hypothetical protein
VINTVHFVVSDALKASMILPVIFLSSNAKLANILLSIIDDSEIIKKILKHPGFWDVKRKPAPRANVVHPPMEEPAA